MKIIKATPLDWILFILAIIALLLFASHDLQLSSSDSHTQTVEIEQ